VTVAAAACPPVTSRLLVPSGSATSDMQGLYLPQVGQQVLGASSGRLQPISCRRVEHVTLAHCAGCLLSLLSPSNNQTSAIIIIIIIKL